MPRFIRNESETNIGGRANAHINEPYIYSIFTSPQVQGNNYTPHYRPISGENVIHEPDAYSLGISGQINLTNCKVAFWNIRDENGNRIQFPEMASQGRPVLQIAGNTNITTIYIPGISGPPDDNSIDTMLSGVYIDCYDLTSGGFLLTSFCTVSTSPYQPNNDEQINMDGFVPAVSQSTIQAALSLNNEANFMFWKEIPLADRIPLLNISEQKFFLMGNYPLIDGGWNICFAFYETPAIPEISSYPLVAEVLGLVSEDGSGAIIVDGTINYIPPNNPFTKTIKKIPLFLTGKANLLTWISVSTGLFAQLLRRKLLK
jgi:hypothetical protein